MHRSVWLLAAVAAVTSVCLAVPALAGAATFSNTAPITINDAGASCPGSPSPSPAPGAASPYPSAISVSGFTGTITDVNVTLSGLTHSFADDVAVLLVAPAGQTTLLMADTGGGVDVFGVNLTFDDAAAASLPDESPLASGSYKPTVGSITGVGFCTVPSSFPTPAPGGPYGSALSVFNGTDPNGTWSLYVIDDTLGDLGSIAGGWSLEISGVEVPPDAGQALGDLRELVAGLGIHHGLANALDAKLQNALAALEADDTAGACDALQAFLNQVSAQSGKKLTEEQAEQLTVAANDIRTQLDC
jgi:subtilisin-like proprotein convertase family protein